MSLFATFHFFLHLRPSFWAIFLFPFYLKFLHWRSITGEISSFCLYGNVIISYSFLKIGCVWYTVLEWWSVSLRTLKTFSQSLLASIVMAKNSGDGLSIAILKVLCPFPLEAFRSSLSLMICGFLSVCLSMDFFLLILLIYVVFIMSEDLCILPFLENSHLLSL